MISARSPTSRTRTSSPSTSSSRTKTAGSSPWSWWRASISGRWIANGDVDRLRDAFRQLALGVEALHATGRLHRDIKASNVMVDSRGRVVLLDFGLVSARRSASAGDSILDPMGGTPAYMSPEQSRRRGVGPGLRLVQRGRDALRHPRRAAALRGHGDRGARRKD